MSRVLAPFLLVLACANCAAPSSDATSTGDDAIVGGVDARGREPAVVAVVTPYMLCTGTLVAPDLVVTARHCVARTTGCPSPETLAITPVVPQEPATVGIVRGDSADGETPVAARAIVFSEPFRCEEDIAAILLERPVEGASVLPVASAPPEDGARVRVVGYGVTESGAFGDKRIREGLAVTSVSAVTFRVGEGTCSGDSGGPAIDERTGAVVGVLSNGSVECSGEQAFASYTGVWRFGSLIARAAALR